MPPASYFSPLPFSSFQPFLPGFQADIKATRRGWFSVWCKWRSEANGGMGVSRQGGWLDPAQQICSWTGVPCLSAAHLLQGFPTSSALLLSSLQLFQLKCPSVQNSQGNSQKLDGKRSQPSFNFVRPHTGHCAISVLVNWQWISRPFVLQNPF